MAMKGLDSFVNRMGLNAESFFRITCWREKNSTSIFKGKNHGQSLLDQCIPLYL
jgi:hypothetical protein